MVIGPTFKRTGWRKPIGCRKLQVILRKRATNHRALLRKMTWKHKASYGSSPPCIEPSFESIYSLSIWYPRKSISFHLQLYFLSFTHVFLKFKILASQIYLLHCKCSRKPALFPRPHVYYLRLIFSKVSSIPSISKFSKLSSISSSTYLFPNANILESGLHFLHFLAEEWVSYGQVPVRSFSTRKLATKHTSLNDDRAGGILTLEILDQPKKAKVWGPFTNCSSRRTHWWRRWSRRRNRARSRGHAMMKYPVVNSNSQVNLFPKLVHYTTFATAMFYR